jgi:hypothetical protein
MFVEYGYDYFQPPPPVEFDETFYKEMVYPIKRKEAFNNDLENILDEIDDDLNNTQQSQSNYYNKMYFNKMLNEKNTLCNNLSSQCSYYKQLIHHKYQELYKKNNQIFIFYILLFIAILVIIYQRMSIENMSNLLYMLRMSSKDFQIKESKQ